jgi:hypothetical protein
MATPPIFTPAPARPPAPKPITPGFGQLPDVKGMNPRVNRAPKDTIFSDSDRGIWVGYEPEKPKPGPWTRYG